MKMKTKQSLLVLLIILATADADEPNCLNGGIGFSNGTCYCANYWEGALCNETLCINGGFPSEDRKYCNCPPGYLGVHCEATLSFSEPLNAFSADISFNVYIFSPVSLYYGRLALNAFVSSIKKDSFVSYSEDGHSYSYYNKFTLQIQNDNSSGGILVGGTTSGEMFASLTDLNKTDLPQPKSYECYSIPLYKHLHKQIADYRLSHTVLTVFTQHPGDTEDYDNLVEIALSFGVKINVAFSNDKYMIGCDADATVAAATDKLRKLAEVTSGAFIEIDRDNPSTTTDIMMKLHPGQQQISYAAGNCTSSPLKVTVSPDQHPDTYTVLVRGDTSAVRTTISGTRCTYTIVQDTDNQATYTFSALKVSRCDFEVNSTGLCSLQVIRNPEYAETNELSVGLYVSYVENNHLDTSNVQMLSGGKFFVSLHARSGDVYKFVPRDVQLMSDTGLISSSVIPFNFRPYSAFEYISNATISCDVGKAQKFWLQVSLTVEGLPGLVERRYIFVDCFAPLQTGSTTTAAPTSTGHSTTTQAEPTMGTLTGGNCTSVKPPPMTPGVVLGLSLGLENGWIASYTYPFRIPAFMQSLYSNFGLLTFDDPVINYYKESTNHSGFADVVGDLRHENVPANSNVITMLKALVKNCTMPETTAVFLSGVLPLDDKVDQELAQFFTNRRHPVFAIFDETKKSSANLFFKDLAIMSNGHYIVMYDDPYVAESPIEKAVSDLLQYAASQELMLAKNYIIANSEGTLGTIDLSDYNTSTDVTFFFSLHTAIEAMDDLQQPCFILNAESTTTVLQPIMQMESSLQTNYFGQLFTLPGGDKYTMTVQHFDNDKWVFARIWKIRNNTTYPSLTYNFVSSIKNSTTNKFEIENPDVGIGMTVRGILRNITENFDTVSAVLLNCNGVPLKDKDGGELEVHSTLYDGTTCVDAYFGPHFFDKKADNSANCSSDRLTDIYGLRVLLESKGRVVRQYQGTVFYSPAINEWCQNSAPNASTPDQLCDCTGLLNGSYHSGPLCQFVDCSGNGELVYNDLSASYECKCDEGFNGTNCEQGTCTPSEFDRPGLLDTQFRTLSVLVALQQNNDSNYYNQTLREIFEDAGIYDTIWQYHLVAFYGVDDNATTLYVGGSFDEFVNSFAILDEPKTLSKSKQPLINFSRKTLLHAFRAVGASVNGIVLVLHPSGSLTFVDEDVEFYKAIHPFTRHQMYVAMNLNGTGKSDVEKIAGLVQATSGALLHYDTAVIAAVLHETMPRSMSLNYLDVVTLRSNEDETTQVVQFENAYNTALIIVTTSCSPNTTGSGPSLDPASSCPSVNYTSGSTTVIVTNCNGSTPIDSTLTVKFSAYADCKAYVTAQVRGGFSPIVRLVRSLKDDDQTALPVSNALPKLIVYKGGEYNITQNDTMERVFEPRPQCHFSVSDEVLSVTNNFNFSTTGMHPLKLSISYSTSQIEKTIPFVFANEIECMDGRGTTNLKDKSSCLCDTGFWGPDCRRVKCKNGLANAFLSACNCKDEKALHHGQFCEL